MTKMTKAKKLRYSFKKDSSSRVAERSLEWVIAKKNQRKSSRIELKYEGKLDDPEFLNQLPDVSLARERSFGQMGFQQPSNVLIWGDNLLALKTLLCHSDVNGKARLIYIDPPFATNQIF